MCVCVCEQVVELLLASPAVQSLIDAVPQLDNLDNERTTCLHLAARNGHVDVIKYVHLLRPPYAQYTPPTRLNWTVKSRLRRLCVFGFIIRNYEYELSAIASCMLYYAHTLC